MLKIYFTNRFFVFLVALCLSVFAIEINKNAFVFVAVFAAVILAMILLDVLALFSSKSPVSVQRSLNTILSLGDVEQVSYSIQNLLNVPIKLVLYDNYPKEFLKRDFKITASIGANKQLQFTDTIKAYSRGSFCFNWIDVYLSTPFNLLQRRISFSQVETVRVYPSIIQLKKYSIANIKKSVLFHGVKKVRKVGHSYDFDHIKQYAVGDDVRSINWKAASRKSELMVNHYEDEKSQAVYCIIDKSRVMNMPFNHLSLLDYAINATLVISNAALQHQDKAGLITFSDVLGSVIPAGSKKNQLRVINESLYNQKHRDTEPNYPLLYYGFNKLSRKRSLLFLFTNFETTSALERQLTSILAMAKNHVLVLILFKNKEAEQYYNGKIETKSRMYKQAVAERYFAEKLRIVKKIKSVGIRCIYTYPDELTVNTLNEYTALKASGVI